MNAGRYFERTVAGACHSVKARRFDLLRDQSLSTTAGTGATESRGVMRYEVILGAYSPLSIAAMSPVLLSR